MCSSTAVTSLLSSPVSVFISITESKVNDCEGETFFELGLKLRALLGV